MNSLKRRRSLATCGGSWWQEPWLGLYLGLGPPPWIASKSSDRSVRGRHLSDHSEPHGHWTRHCSCVKCSVCGGELLRWTSRRCCRTQTAPLSHSDSARFTAPLILKGMCGAVFSTWWKKGDCSRCGGAMESMFLKSPQKLLSSSQLMNRWSRLESLFFAINYSLFLLHLTFFQAFLMISHCVSNVLKIVIFFSLNQLPIHLPTRMFKRIAFLLSYWNLDEKTTSLLVSCLQKLVSLA